jgi:hypothetical protein
VVLCFDNNLKIFPNTKRICQKRVEIIFEYGYSSQHGWVFILFLNFKIIILYPFFPHDKNYQARGKNIVFAAFNVARNNFRCVVAFFYAYI